MVQCRIVIVLILVALVVISCDKEGIGCDHRRFCASINARDFDAAGLVVGGLLSHLNDQQDEAVLDQVDQWLRCKPCVLDVEIICRSCVYTLPTISELRVVFESNGQPIVQTMDIVMDNPPRFGGFHDD